MDMSGNMRHSTMENDMVKQFRIFGDIICCESERLSGEDISPSDVKTFIDGLAPNEDAEFLISSCGGNVFGALAIVNLIRDAGNAGHGTRCRIVGIAASSASVIACACNELTMDTDALFMLHLPYTSMTGNKDALQKEAKTLDLLGKTLASIYATKFDRTEDEIISMMESETWISSTDIDTYGLKCTIDGNSADIPRIAASLKHHQKSFNRQDIIERILMKEDIEKEEVKEEVKEEPKTEETAGEPKTETEEPKEDTEALKARIAELEEEVKRLKEEQEKPIEERLAKCQSVFQNKINDLKKEQQERDGKLRDYENRVSNLEAELATSKGELTRVQAALAEKENALVRLNASVLKPSSVRVYDKASAREELARLPMTERADFYSKHRETIG